jgi:hypothetical protein
MKVTVDESIDAKAGVPTVDMDSPLPVKLHVEPLKSYALNVSASTSI